MGTGGGTTPSGRGRRRAATPSVPLGSLSQAAAVPPGTSACVVCGSGNLTRVPVRLTDGSEVTFVSCHDCEAKGWFDSAGASVAHEWVLSRSGRKA